MKTYQNYNSKNKKLAATLRKDMPVSEKKIWFNYLKLLRPRCRRQRPIGNYIVDFYIPEYKIAIEIDGDSHFISEKAISYDLAREKYLQSVGVTIVRFTNNDIQNNFLSSCEKIQNIIDSYPSGSVNHLPS